MIRLLPAPFTAYLFATLVYSLASVGTVLASAPATPDYSTAEKTIDAVVEFATRSVVTLDHDIFVYHYRPQGADSIGALQANAAAMYSRFVVKSVYAPNKWSGELGTGLYAALDPLTSRSYGGDEDWLLFQIRVARGSRYWNLESEQETNYPIELAGALARFFNCQAGNDYDLTEKSACFAVRTRVLRKLKVTGIAYPFITPTSGVDASICPGQSDLAFFFTNLVPFRKEDITIFNPSYLRFADGAIGNRRLIEWLFLLSPGAAEAPLWPKIDPIWSFDMKKARREAQVWARENLLGCASPKTR